MKMHNRVRIEKPDGREIRFTQHTVRGRDVGMLEAAMWDPEQSEWQIQGLDREDVRMVCDFLNAWLGEDD